MSVPLLHAVYSMPPGKLTHLQKSVLARLAFAADDYGNNVWIGLKTITASTETSKRGVQNALAELQADGWIATEQPSAGRGRTVHRCLNVEKIQPGYLKTLAEKKGAPDAPFAGKGAQNKGAPGAPIAGKGAQNDTNGTQKGAPGAHIYKPEQLDRPEHKRRLAVCSVGSLSSKGEPAEEQPPRDWQAEMRKYKAESPGWNRGIVTSATS